MPTKSGDDDPNENAGGNASLGLTNGAAAAAVPKENDGTTIGVVGSGAAGELPPKLNALQLLLTSVSTPCCLSAASSLADAATAGVGTRQNAYTAVGSVAAAVASKRHPQQHNGGD